MNKTDKEVDRRPVDSSGRAAESSQGGRTDQTEVSRLAEAEVSIKEVIGRNLKLAREAADLSQDQFADLLGVSRATLSGFENGKVAIDSAKLLKAAQIFGKPVSDFFRQDEHEFALMYRAAEETVPNNSVRSRFQQQCEAFRDLEEIVGVADTVLPPPEYKYLPAFQSKPYQFAVQVAQSERERLGLGQVDPIPNIFRLLDENGVRVFPIDIDQEKVFGLSAFSNRYGPCILVNTKKHTLERNVFTLAHEYGHLLMHRNCYINASPAPQRDRDLEDVANFFAAHFLVPEPGLRSAVSRATGKKVLGIEDIVFLKHHFKVSAQVMLRRLRDSELLSQKEHDDLFARVRGFVSDETQEILPLRIDLIGSWKQVCRFQFLARKAALGEMVSIGRLAELLGQNLIQTRHEVQSWRKELASAPA